MGFSIVDMVLWKRSRVNALKCWFERLMWIVRWSTKNRDGR